MQGLRAFQRYFDFAGRSDRAEYWQFFGICFIAVFGAFVLDFAVGNGATPVLTYLMLLIIFIPSNAAAVRRLHDRDRSGWWVAAVVGMSLLRFMLIYQAGRNAYTPVGDVLVTLIKITQYIVLGLDGVILFQLVKAGTEGPNRFGPPPALADVPPPTVEQLVGRLKQLGSSPASTSPQTSSAADPLQQIARLAELRDAGALTETEFTERKAALLDRL